MPIAVPSLDVLPLFRLTDGDYGRCELLQAMLKVTGPAEVTVSSWTLGRAEAAVLGDLVVAGQITSLRLVLDGSALRKEDSRYEGIAALGVPVAYTKNHAKWTVVRGQERVLVETSSMNFNQAPRREQYRIEEDPVLADYLLASVARGVVEGLPEKVDRRDVNDAFEADRLPQDQGRPPPPPLDAGELAIREWVAQSAEVELANAKPGSIAARDALKSVIAARFDLLEARKALAPPPQPTPPADAVVGAIVGALPGWHPAWIERILFRAAEVLGLDLAPALDAHHRVEL